MFKWSAGITMVGLALGGLLLTGTPAAAQSAYGPNIDQREAYQQQRIQRGIDSGALTPGETRYLEREQGRIQAAEQRMEADGHLSPWERQRLNQMQNQASRDINRLEHNNRTAAGWGGNNHQGWSGHTNSGWRGNNYDGRGGRGYAWQGNNPGGGGYAQGWRGNGTQGWQGNNPGGNGTAANGNTAPGNTQGWRGNNPGGSGTATSGAPTAGNTQGWRNGSGNGTAVNGTSPAGNATGTTGSASTGNANYRNGQPGSYQQPGAQAAQARQQYQRPPIQGTQSQMRTNQSAQYQQARSQMPQTQMRPNANMMARQPSGVGSMANRASYSAPKAAPRRR